MAELELSVAVGDYDRTRPLVDGRVRIDGARPVFMLMSPEEMFFRAMRSADFDVTELSFSSYLIRLSRGDSPYVAVPVFLSRAFRHTSIYVRKDRIAEPADLKGKRVGLPEYQLTANVWARAILHDDYQVHPRDVTWVRGGISTAGRKEKVKLALPPDITLEDAPADRTISDMLDEGELDAFIGPRPPAGKASRNPGIDWLFDDPVAAAKDYYQRTGIFPIMHVLGIRRKLCDRHPWLAANLVKAFTEAKSVALEMLSDTSATKVTLPFVEEQLRSVREFMGHDYWSYGVAGSRKTLEAFLRHHNLQGLSARKLSVEEIFHPATYEAFSI